MTFRRPRFGLAARFSLLISLPVLVASLALSYNFIEYSERAMETEMIVEAKGKAKAVSRASEYGLLVEDQEGLNRAIKTILEQDVVYVLIRNISGEIVASHGDVMENIPADIIADALPVDEQELDLNYRMAETGIVQHIICDVVIVRERRSREDIDLLQLETLPGPESGKVEKIGTVQLGLSRADMIDHLHKAKLRAIGLTTVVITVAILATVVLVRVMVRPIERLAVATEEVSRGDFEHTVEAKSKDEIGILAGSFNKMMADLKRSREALQHRLEVEERITRELEKKTEELSRSNEELNALLYSIVHGMKAHAVSLQGLSILLMNEYGDGMDGNGKMYIGRIQKNSERMGALIEDLLKLSRIDRVKYQEERVNISDVISDVADEIAAELKERGTRLIVKDVMPEIRCDRSRIRQVFANLVDNANKFMGEGNQDPTIEVGYRDQDGHHTFYVKDNGIGIDKEYHERIFEVLRRLDDVETEGTGMGLAIVKKMVKSFGGKIWVDSAKGKGTTMYFTVPNHKKEV